MKKAILSISFLLIFLSTSFSQEKNNVSIDLGISQVHSGFFYLYDGVIDMGAGYNQNITGNLYTGASLHFDFLNRKNTSARTVVYKPKINLHYDMRISEKVHIVPLVALGYSFVNIANKEFNYKETQSGINIGTDLRILWETFEYINFYLFGRYDYIYLDKDESFTRLEYFREIHLTSIGIGIKLIPKNQK